MKQKTGGQTVENQRFPTVQTPRFSDGAGCEGSSHSGLADDEIIKALECCTNEGVADCDNCPYDGICNTGENRMLNDTLSLIICQKSELAFKQSELNLKSNEARSYYLENEELKAEIERLRKENEILSTNADNAFQEGLNESRELFKQEVEAAIRAEAIKEFTKVLDKTLSIYYKNDQCISVGQFKNIIKIVVKKEMVGDV